MQEEKDNKPDDTSEPHEARPLDYASGLYGERSSAGRSVLSVFQYILGLLFGLMGVWPIAMSTLFIQIHPGPASRPSPRPGPEHLNTILLFAGICVVGGIGLLAVFRSYKSGRRHWFLAGFLTGVCLAALMAGICFTIA